MDIMATQLGFIMQLWVVLLKAHCLVMLKMSLQRPFWLKWNMFLNVDGDGKPARDRIGGNKVNNNPTTKYMLKYYVALSLAHTALCLRCGSYKQGTGCLSFLGSVNILSTNKFLLSERGETHTIEAAALSLHLSLWCPSERPDNEGSLHLNSFDWSVDVTGCWYLSVIVWALCGLPTSQNPYFLAVRGQLM